MSHSKCFKLFNLVYANIQLSLKRWPKTYGLLSNIINPVDNSRAPLKSSYGRGHSSAYDNHSVNTFRIYFLKLKLSRNMAKVGNEEKSCESFVRHKLPYKSHPWLWIRDKTNCLNWLPSITFRKGINVAKCYHPCAVKKYHRGRARNISIGVFGTGRLSSPTILSIPQY